MGKKKFIDKKKSATFTLIYRESEADDTSEAPSRIFTRVDGGDGYVKGFSDDDPRYFMQSECGDGPGDRDAIEEGSDGEEFDSDGEEESRFDDADEESGEEDVAPAPKKRSSAPAAAIRKGLSAEKRRELIEMGYPDDGYDYLQHMRKIGTSGVGSFVPATRVELNSLRADVKAYDATKVQVQPTDEDSKDAERKAIELVSSNTRPVRKPLLKEGVLDKDIIAALEDSDGSQFDSADELEDEFVILANDGVEERGSTANGASASGRSLNAGPKAKQSHVEESDEDFDSDGDYDVDGVDFPRKERQVRVLDEQFETLALREYDINDFGELDEDDPTTRGRSDISEFSSVLSEFLTDKQYCKERYETPAEEIKKEVLTIPSAADRAIGSSFDKDAKSSMIIHSGVDDAVIRKTLEYRSDDDKEVVTEEASDEEKEHWDCETIVSTLSNLDNHPGKISAPGPMKHRIKLQDLEKSDTGIIRLGGKQKLPLDYLPKRALAPVKEDEKLAVSGKSEPSSEAKKTLSRAGETPEEKKARKAAIKEERRQARAGKKALKLVYREDAHRAQRGAAVMGPSSIHLP
ncbi:protein LTV1 [Marchantia polymorpha subsp. ruderalis]|uniref:Protein LTV1 homolog n=1 Tax=Marchantia polymorpha TaxID=3197 RepID=A0A2R6WKY6_MARPO|nr:hypothetical protein MARPO_0079s0035 [Marchantia polymorpha]BBN20026.1 hypothetical protein Mp_8g15770 [Marchantia polymorpha subsp. ruderalis]|eukprot:PTQ34526.1 hypothetical protein MARPO_0079s0035 [Marchantia polymorpha]